MTMHTFTAEAIWPKAREQAPRTRRSALRTKIRRFCTVGTFANRVGGRIGIYQAAVHMNLAKQVVVWNPVLKRQRVVEEFGLPLGLFAHHGGIPSLCRDPEPESVLCNYLKGKSDLGNSPKRRDPNLLQHSFGLAFVGPLAVGHDFIFHL